MGMVNNSETTMNDKELSALESVIGGADVYDYGLACTLRQIEKKYPAFIEIGKAQAFTGTGTDRMPYFGAMATEAGIEAVVRSAS
jgi:hypothetical protein